MKNYSLDVLKFISALMVVVIHAGSITTALGHDNFTNYYWYRHLLNLAVPIFFASSGFVLANKSNQRMKKYAIDLFKLFLQFSVFYIIWDFITIGIDALALPSGNFSDFFNSFQIEHLQKGTFGKYHLWWLLATSQSVFIMYLLRKVSLKPYQILSLSIGIFVLWHTDTILPVQLLAYGGLAQGFLFTSLGYFIGCSSFKRKHDLTIAVILMALYWISRHFFAIHYLEDILWFFIVLRLLRWVKFNPGKKRRATSLKRYADATYLLHVAFLELYRQLVQYVPGLAIESDGLRTIVLTVLAFVFSVIFYPMIQKYLNLWMRWQLGRT